MADKIAAVSTGRARTGIGILRLSGDGCIEAAGTVFRPCSGQTLASLPDRKLVLGTLYDVQGRELDHCMAFISRAPHSYTGEDTAEIQCHGSPAALAAGLEALFAAGFRQARPGEFTRRAFLNGRMDLTQAEAVIDLIDAETADAAANAAGQIAGAIRRKIDPIYDSWVDICAHFHAVLDYPDEDIDPFELSRFEDALTESSRTLLTLLASCHRGRMVQSGIRAAILGSPNAGKSSLLNRLAGFDRVIVTDIPGTTRDTVEQTATLGRHLVRLVDTAGIRDTEDVIERIGVDRSVEAAKDCDVALFVVDGSRPLTEEDSRLTCRLPISSPSRAGTAPALIFSSRHSTCSSRTMSRVTAHFLQTRGRPTPLGAQSALWTQPSARCTPDLRRTPCWSIWRAPCPPSARSRAAPCVRTSRTAFLSGSALENKL